MPYCRISDSAAKLRFVNSCVWCYRGDVVTPKWKDVDTSESYLTLLAFFDELIVFGR